MTKINKQIVISDDKIQEDVEFIELQSECLDTINRQFCDFQQQALPIIQENYMQRNAQFARCVDQLDGFKKKIAAGKKALQVQFESFQKGVFAEIGKQSQIMTTDYLAKYEEQKTQNLHLEAQKSDFLRKYRECSEKLQLFADLLSEEQNSIAAKSKNTALNNVKMFNILLEENQEFEKIKNTIANIETQLKAYALRHDAIWKLIEQ